VQESRNTRAYGRWGRMLDPKGMWAYAVVILGILMVLAVLYDPSYRAAFDYIWPGVQMTLLLTITAFALSLVIGLFAGLARVSTNPILYNIATFYVEAIRGVPILVQLLYVTFVIFPLFVDGLTAVGFDISIRNVEMHTRVILGLALAYGAFEAEVFRAGIESIGKGQMEAARSLGMSYFQAMRYVVLPQALRVVLPPLGNDFVAMLKDSSLISVVALPETLQQGRLWVSRTFRAFEGYNTVALFYLVMTLLLSLLVRLIERRTSLPGQSEESK